MKVDILSREYPPKVYGGAGVHAEELSKVLAERVDVTVRAFDGPRTAADIPAIPGTDPKGSLTVVGYDVPKELEDANGALKTFGVDCKSPTTLMPTSSMRIHGTHVLPAILPKCCMTPHWSSPRTRLNRSVHGNVNSWAAATI